MRSGSMKHGQGRPKHHKGQGKHAFKLQRKAQEGACSGMQNTVRFLATRSERPEAMTLFFDAMSNVASSDTTVIVAVRGVALTIDSSPQMLPAERVRANWLCKPPSLTLTSTWPALMM